jgi:cleavage stimulation factor subunit 3
MFRSAFGVLLTPFQADVWIAYIEMELDLSDFVAAEALFGKCLKDVLNVQLWTVYLDYIRRRNDLSDSSGEARRIVTQAYEFVLDHVGHDKDAGKIWQEYIQFLRFGPGTLGESGWQDTQKADRLRKAYREAVCVPMSNVNTLWKEYDQFEMGINKTTGRKFLADRSPGYMTAKSANTSLENLTRGLRRSNIPKLPPAPGFDGDEEYVEQVELWKKWIAWEKSDPLELNIEKDGNLLLRKRILYCYKQALMALRFWPEMWVDAAEWCFENDINEDGKDKGIDFLIRGIAANPESLLLALKHGDRIERTFPIEEGQEAKRIRGAAVRAPYDKILDTLYELIKTVREKEKKLGIPKIDEATAKHAKDEEADDSDEEAAKARARDEQVALLRQGVTAQVDLLSKSLTFVWIALARAMRRIQGKGVINGPLGGLRQVFQDARGMGRLGSEIYVEIAKMEWKCYDDKAGGKIFERGAKLFPEDPNFMIEYIKYMIAHKDTTSKLCLPLYSIPISNDPKDSRVVFETCVDRLTKKPENVHKAKPLLSYMHKYESNYGDLTRVVELERRMAALYPEDPKLANFSVRFSTSNFDPITARIIISPATQLRPKMILPSVERGVSVLNSPRPMAMRQASPLPPHLLGPNSPKRPFPTDDFEDLNPPRKLQRGESPLKGAAGRRLDQQRRLQGLGPVSSSAPPAPIPTMVTFLLGQMPAAGHYNGDRLDGGSLARILAITDTDLASWEARSGKQPRQTSAQGRHPPQSHARQVSADYAAFPGRNSPGLGTRPLSPYTSGARPGPPSAVFAQAGLRPDSRGSYEPPTPVYRQDAPPAQFAPPPGQYEAPLGTPAWPPQQPQPAPGMPPGYGVPPSQNYGATPQYPPQPSAQQGSYPGYRY